MPGTDDPHGTAHERGYVDFQRWFYAACGCILLLGGSLFGYWNVSIWRDLDDKRTTDQAQWRKIGEHNDALRNYGARLERDERDTHDVEQRLREIERIVAKHH